MSDDGPFWRGGLGPHPAPGSTVAHYQVDSLLGSGGMATVFRARDVRGAGVALKVLNPARVLPEDVKRFTREYKTLSRMDHDNVVQVHEAGVHEGYPWIAMELVEGTDLDSVIMGWRASPPPDHYARVERILRGLCRGLQYVHDLGMVHRDLKPSNVLLTVDGEPKISDFGVVKGGSNTAITQLTMAGRLVGTVAFMAPELITDEEVDRRVDLYALGAVIYLMCTFQRPIEADSVAGYLARHLTEVPRPLADYDPQAPPRLERICQRLLQKDKSWRYPTASAVLQALDRPEDANIPPLRGRDAELALWSRWVLGLQDGIGGAVAIVGPSGGGKTHLLGGFLDQVHSNGLRCATATGSGHVISELRADAARGDDGDEGNTIEDMGTLADVIRGQPFVLAIDDLDEANDATVTALSRLLRQRVAIDAEPLLLLFTASDTQGTLAPLMIGASTGLPCEVVRAGAIDAKSAVAIVRDRGVTGPAAPVLGRRLHTDYTGLPGPVMQQLEALIDAGWFSINNGHLRASRPLDDFRKADLPVPPEVQRQVLIEVETLQTESRHLAELLAVIGRPAAAGLVERCRPHDDQVARRIDAMVQHGVVDRDVVDAQETLRLRHPCAVRVIRGVLNAEDKREYHAHVARALGVRRRSSGREVAEHLEASGDARAAYPMYIAAARRTAREGRFSEVLEITRRANDVRSRAEPFLEPDTRANKRRWLELLTGEALLARRAWDEAITPLRLAVAAARDEGDRQAIARCLGSLGRAHYRRGNFAKAAPLLSEALDLAEPGAPERAAALRALADIQLRQGHLDVSEKLWTDALRAGMDVGSRDAEARARRGLAHVRAIQGRLDASGELLAQADELLNPDGDYRVRAGVLARLIELDIAAGRFGSALYRSELLVDLARRHGMSERLPEAYSLLAQLLANLADPDNAHDAAQQALIFAKATGVRSWQAQLRATRVLLQLGFGREAEMALPDAATLPASQVYDPPAQHAALYARLFARIDAGRCRDLSTWTLTRPPPTLGIRAAEIALDCAHALMAIGQNDPARSAIKHGLKQLQGHGADGLRLELLVLMHQAAPDHRVLDAVGQVARRMLPQLPATGAEAFRTRNVIADALRD